MQSPMNMPGQNDLNFSYAWSPMVKKLIILNVILYVFELILLWLGSGDSLYRQFINAFGLKPIAIYQNFMIWQFLTAMFLHSLSPFHLLFNMLMLWMFGSPVERAWGSREFLKYYLLTGIAANMVHFFFYYNSPIPVIGASGAVMGIILAFALTYPDAIVLIGLIFPVKAKYLAIGVIIIDLLYLFTDPNSTTAHVVHLAGVGIGFIYLKIFKQARIPLPKIRKIKRMRRQQQEEDNPNLDRHRVIDMVDRILDKINEYGIDSLTEQEKRILERASHLFSEEENYKN